MGAPRRTRGVPHCVVRGGVGGGGATGARYHTRPFPPSPPIRETLFAAIGVDRRCRYPEIIAMYSLRREYAQLKLAEIRV